MERVSAVIGASWGDEGKGLVTDFLCRGEPLNTLVVRFNGGAQAGHTVVAPEGRRHVFHHFGSGTLAGSPTFLSRFFIVNPMIFGDERRTIMELGYTPSAYIDPAARVTTPFDMMLNMAAEEARGSQRHGSCGLGINETVTRSERAEFALTYGDLVDVARTKRLLHRIRTEWVPARAAALGLDLAANRVAALDYVMDDGVIRSYLADVSALLGRSVRFPWGESLLKHWDNLVFEGAQGLRLDEFSPDFPHVTRSRTGLTNVLLLTREVGLKNIQTYYVTRPYMTRHGAGPFLTEIDHLPYSKVRDDTNVEGPWQGKLRFGWLDPGSLYSFVQRDFAQAEGEATPHVVLTCVDQLDDGQTFRVMTPTGRLKDTTLDAFVADALLRREMKSVLTSHGETCKTMTARLMRAA